MPKLGEFIFGHGDRSKKISTMEPGQKNFLNQLTQLLGGQGLGGQGLEQALGLLTQYLNPTSDVYKSFEEPYKQQFEQETVPMLSERFAGYGGGMGGGLSSSGFGQALSAGATNLQTNLAQMKSGMQRNSINDLLNLFAQLSGQTLGTRSFENVYQPGNTGLVGQAIPAAIQAFAAGG